MGINWLFVCTFPLRWIVGGFLFVIGTLTYNSHWRSLGYYVLGVGGVLRVSMPGHFPMLAPHREDSIHGWIVKQPGTGYDKRFYNTVGKAHYASSKKYLYMKDTYRFYPWCGALDHFYGCECDDSEKSWACVNPCRTRISTISSFPKIRFGVTKGKLWFEFSFGKDILIEKSRDIEYKGTQIVPSFEIWINYTTLFFMTCSDQWFSYFGKPFLQVGKLNKRDGAILNTAASIAKNMERALTIHVDEWNFGRSNHIMYIRQALEDLLDYYPDVQYDRKEVWNLAKKQLRYSMRRYIIEQKAESIAVRFSDYLNEHKFESTVIRAYVGATNHLTLIGGIL